VTQTFCPAFVPQLIDRQVVDLIHDPLSLSTMRMRYTPTLPYRLYYSWNIAPSRLFSRDEYILKMNPRRRPSFFVTESATLYKCVALVQRWRLGYYFGRAVSFAEVVCGDHWQLAEWRGTLVLVDEDPSRRDPGAHGSLWSGLVDRDKRCQFHIPSTSPKLNNQNKIQTRER